MRIPDRGPLEEDAARGMEAAKRAIHAIADGDDATALRHLSNASAAEVAWAAGYLLACLRSSALTIAKGDTAKASRRLHAAANEREDIAFTQASVIVDAAFKREGL